MLSCPIGLASASEQVSDKFADVCDKLTTFRLKIALHDMSW